MPSSTRTDDRQRHRHRRSRDRDDAAAIAEHRSEVRNTTAREHRSAGRSTGERKAHSSRRHRHAHRSAGNGNHRDHGRRHHHHHASRRSESRRAGHRRGHRRHSHHRGEKKMGGSDQEGPVNEFPFGSSKTFDITTRHQQIALLLEETTESSDNLTVQLKFKVWFRMDDRRAGDRDEDWEEWENLGPEFIDDQGKVRHRQLVISLSNRDREPLVIDLPRRRKDALGRFEHSGAVLLIRGGELLRPGRSDKALVIDWSVEERVQREATWRREAGRRREAGDASR